MSTKAASVRIEILAALVAALVQSRNDEPWAQQAMTFTLWSGWATHHAGRSPNPAFGEEHMAGWLARQIWCHGRGDDSEHVLRALTDEQLVRKLRNTTGIDRAGAKQAIRDGRRIAKKLIDADKKRRRA